MRIAGLGFRKGATLASLQTALALAEKQGGPADALATIPGKAGALTELAAARGLPVHAVPVAGVITPTQSPRVQQMHGTGSVAEAAALTAAGPGAQLTVTRISAPDGMATCAMAETQGTHP